MNGMQIFQNAEFGPVRIIGRDGGELRFVARDLCACLGIGNTGDVIALWMTMKRGSTVSIPPAAGRRCPRFQNRACIRSSSGRASRRPSGSSGGSPTRCSRPSVGRGGYGARRPGASELQESGGGGAGVGGQGGAAAS